MKLICWNMAGAFGYQEERHARAWQWPNEQDADVALLQEVVLHPEAQGAWGSVAFRRKYKQHGCAVLTKSAGYRRWEGAVKAEAVDVVDGTGHGGIAVGISSP